MSIQPGIYDAKAVDIDMGYTSTGKPQYAVAFELVDTGETITWYGFMTEKTAKLTLESLRHCGWMGNDPGSISAEDLTSIVSLVIEEEEYEDNVYPRVRWVNRKGGVARLRDKMDDAQRTAFGAEFKGLAMSIPAHRDSDDNLPF
jgi:hypothetical protein